MDSKSWHQHNVTFAERESGKRAMAKCLGPALLNAEEAGEIESWWFMNKQPWPLRYRGKRPSPLVQRALDGLVDDGTVTTWAPGIYEPESIAFGGALSMEAAHDLFHEDSRHLLTYEPVPGHLGRRETAVLLISAMMRAANLGWFEQGDVWAKAAALRAPAEVLPAERAAALTAPMRILMTVDIRSLYRPDGPLDGHAEWVAAYERAGTKLASLNSGGGLSRGLRTVIAHHVIFHANRAGLPLHDQIALFAVARETVMGSSDTFASPTRTTPGATSVR
jgi:protein-L-isoaspartate(D-aspartate) O-methyltransferase